MPIASTPIKPKLNRMSSFDYGDAIFSSPRAHILSSSTDRVQQQLGINKQDTIDETPIDYNGEYIIDKHSSNIESTDVSNDKLEKQQSTSANKFIERTVKYTTTDENGTKTENNIVLKTLEDLHKIPSKYLTAQERLLLKGSRWTPSQVLMAHLEAKLNTTIGKYWWKKYVSAAFWSNIATPINLAITLSTTLTTGQAATDNLLSQDTFVRISIASLILSTLNTFFRPHQQTNCNIEAMNKWRQLGTKFEEIYYSECFNDLDYDRRIRFYQELQKDVHNEQITQESTIQNYLTDLIYFFVSNSCLAKSEWITEKHKTIQNNQHMNTSDTKTGKNNKQTPNSISIDIPPQDANPPIGNKPNTEILDKEVLKNLVENHNNEIQELNNKYNQLCNIMETYMNKINSIQDNIEDNTDNTEDKSDIYLDNNIIRKHISKKQ